MKTIFLSTISILILTFSASIYAQAENRPSQSLADDPPGEVVKVPGGTYRNILSEQLWAMMEKKDFLLVNVHAPYEGELPDTDTFIPYNEIERNSDKLPSDKTAKIVLYCRTSRMSVIAAETLVKLGYTNVWNLNEGMIEWKQKGLPLLYKSKD
ncbi:MAG: rhodanese-like domain-containing protein [Nitrospirota bacterium]